MSNGYPGITRAALAIAYDNGGINCDRSEEDMRHELAEFLVRHKDRFDLATIDCWLNSLSTHELQTLCCGDIDESDALLATAPPFTNGLLTVYFEEVC